MKYFRIFSIFFLIFSFLGCATAQEKENLFFVQAVLDGDSIILTNAKNVRYIGIDAPELREKINDKWVWNPQPYGVEALNLNKGLVMGKKVRLEFDKEQADRYGRWLAYVFVDDKMVNEELLRRGYAAVYVRQPNTKYLSRLMAAERQARENKKGLWSPAGH